MFGFLKKKLKEGIDKISKAVSEKEEEKIEQAVEEVKKEEHIEEPKEQLLQEVEKAIESPKEAVPANVPKEESKETAPQAPEVRSVAVEEAKIEIKAEESPKAEAKIEKEPEVKIERAAEAKMEEAKELIETAKEVEQIKEEKTTEKEVEKFEKKIEEKIELPKTICEEKKSLFGFLKKPKKEGRKIILEEPVCKVEPKVEEKPPEVEEKGIIDKIRKKITEKKIEEDDIKDILGEIETSLISSDVAVEVADKIIKDLRGNLVGKFIKKGEIEKVVKDSIKNSITEILNVQSFDLIEKTKTKKPFVIIFLGFNGVGKTTSIARIGYLLKKNGISCVFAAADSWRAAAIEQLEEHGKNLGIDVIKHKYGADPAAVIFDAVKHAKSKSVDVVLADTAGRSHSNANLMDELKKIIKVNNPDLKILVLDSLTGNDIYDQCRLFNDAVGIDGMILTKADVYEKGGAALAASHTINKPIIYMGVGQNYEDLEKFDPKKIAERLLD
jgi:fused signal recognition particle receptor